MNDVLHLPTRSLLLAVQALRLGDQRVERRDDLLEIRHLLQMRLDTAVEELPLRDLLRERLCFSHGFLLERLGVGTICLRWTDIPVRLGPSRRPPAPGILGSLLGRSPVLPHADTPSLIPRASGPSS